jgi:hypothetical protein
MIGKWEAWAHKGQAVGVGYSVVLLLTFVVWQMAPKFRAKIFCTCASIYTWFGLNLLPKHHSHGVVIQLQLGKRNSTCAPVERAVNFANCNLNIQYLALWWLFWDEILWSYYTLHIYAFSFEHISFQPKEVTIFIVSAYKRILLAMQQSADFCSCASTSLPLFDLVKRQFRSFKPKTPIDKHLIVFILSITFKLPWFNPFYFWTRDCLSEY